MKLLPEKLYKVENISGFIIYKSSYNNDIYIVFNHKNNLYYSFESNKNYESEEQLKNDLKATINLHFIK